MLDTTLIVGTTGSGKSYAEHKILDRICSQKSGQFILIDPKLVELCDYMDSPLCDRYADATGSTYAAIMHAYDVMNTRLRSMRHDHVKEWRYLPLYVFVDEMGALMNDSAHRKQYGEVLGDVAMKGRAARVFLVLCTQLPTRENLPNSIRDNMTNKVVLRLDDMSRARYVFGPGSNRWVSDLPRYGKCFVRTPDMAHPQLCDTDGICDVLDV